MSSFLTFDIWTAIGFLGQLMFASRFFVQLIASERRKRSYIPLAFWYLSLLGGSITLAYAIHLQSLPFTLAQAGGLFIYSRNLILIHRGRAGTPQPSV